MDWTDTTGGYPQETWDRAKAACRDHIIGVAKIKRMTTYKKSTQAFAHIIVYDPHHPDFHAMLGQISLEEAQDGRPLLSCLVCFEKITDSKNPPLGSGFFGAAETAGFSEKDLEDKMAFWVDQVNKTHQQWC